MNDIGEDYFGPITIKSPDIALLGGGAISGDFLFDISGIDMGESQSCV